MLSSTIQLLCQKINNWLRQPTKILPVPVCPDMSSPAQSLASDMKSPSGAPSGFCPCDQLSFYGFYQEARSEYLQSKLLCLFLLSFQLCLCVLIDRLQSHWWYEMHFQTIAPNQSVSEPDIVKCLVQSFCITTSGARNHINVLTSLGRQSVVQVSIINSFTELSLDK